MKKNVRTNTKALTSAALFAAIIMIFTAYVKVNTGINSGYVHFGDSMIYLAACVLPMPYAAGAAAMGGALADILAGSAVWIPFTAVIKALNTVPFALVYLKSFDKQTGIICIPTLIMSIVSGLITIFGYLIAESFLYSFESAVISVPFSIIQSVGSCIVFVCGGKALDCIKFKTKICNYK